MLIACLSRGVTPRPTVVTDDDFDGSGEILIDDDQSVFNDDVWYGYYKNLPHPGPADPHHRAQEVLL